MDVEYLALLLPVSWLLTAGKIKFWSDQPPSRVYGMRWRINFTGKGSPPMLNAWYVWDSQHSGETVLRMLDKSDNPIQGDIFE